MRRSASEIIRNLERRIARLERQGNLYSDIKNVIEKHLSDGLPLSSSQNQSLIREVDQLLTNDIRSNSQAKLGPHMMDVAEHYFDDFDDMDIFLARMRAIYKELHIR